MALSTRLLALRRSALLLRLPPYLSTLCVLAGVAWLLLLPFDEYSRQTYISENAILPGQVHTYFGGSEHNVFRAYRQEVFGLASLAEPDRLAALESVLRDLGLKAASQTYAFNVAGTTMAGTNVYGILRGPRADATEAMVLIAAWSNFDGELNYSGVALALTLARYFRRWSIWSKDIVILLPEDSVYGPEAWVAAYHSPAAEATGARNISALPIKAGALQGAVALDYPAGPWGHRFDKLDVLYDGINGALPNLDLLNTAVSVASGQMGIPCSLHNMIDHRDDYSARLGTLANGILTQSVGHATGPHSVFMPYHVDAITLKTVGDGWHDEMGLGRVVESLVRSINNLLEHLHQSFFFYILLNTNRFVSIGNYLPAAMIIAGSFTITALALWIQSGRASGEEAKVSSASPKKPKMEVVRHGNDVAVVPEEALRQVERRLFLPAMVLLAVHTAGVVPMYLLNSIHHSQLGLVFHLLLFSTLILPLQLGSQLSTASPQQIQILQSFSLLFLGATLSTLATINFSLAFVVGLICSPLNFVRPLPRLPPRHAIRTLDDAQQYVRLLALYLPCTVLLAALSPPVVLYGVHWYFLGFHSEIGITLLEIAKGWAAQGVWTGLVVWGVWWPAWIVGGAVLYSRTLSTKR